MLPLSFRYNTYLANLKKILILTKSEYFVEMYDTHTKKIIKHLLVSTHFTKSQKLFHILEHQCHHQNNLGNITSATIETITSATFFI
jgi:hypothetical protein